MAASFIYPDWIAGHESWNRVQLGGVFLPGMADISEVPCGKKIDKKPRKGRDGYDIADNGIDGAKFRIELWLVSDDWTLWLAVRPRIDPRKLGKLRSPLEIVHPLPNHMDVRTVYIEKIVPKSPTARGGMKIHIELSEWFPQTKPTKTSKTPQFGPPNYVGDPKDLARNLANKGGFILPPDDPLSITENSGF